MPSITHKATVTGGTVENGITTFTVTVPSISMAAGSRALVRVVARDSSAAAPGVNGCTFSGLTVDLDNELATGPILASVFSKALGGPTSGDVVVEFAKDSNSEVDVIVIVDEVIGADPVDTGGMVAAAGTGTSPASPSTGAITRSDAVVVGLVAIDTFTPVGGTWGGSFINHQSAAAEGNTTNGCAVSTGHRLPSEMLGSTFSAAKTGTTSATWLALCVAYKGKVQTALGLNQAALGAVSDQAITGTLTISSAAAVAGDVVVVGVANFVVLATFTSVTWNGQTFTQIGTTQTNGNLESRLFYLVASATATSDIVASWSLPVVLLTKAMWARRYRGLESPALDRDKQAGGTSTSPSSGNSSTTQQMIELLVGHVATLGPSTDTAGTWSSSYTNGQRAGTTLVTPAENVTVSEGYRSVGVSAAYAAAKTGITSRAWTSHFASFRLISVFVADVTPAAVATTAPGNATRLAAAAAAVGLAPVAPATSPSIAASAGAVSLVPSMSQPASALALAASVAVLGCSAPSDPSVGLGANQPADTTTAASPYKFPSNTMPMNDEDLETWAGASGGLFETNGTLEIDSHGVQDVYETVGGISHVVLVAYVRARKDASVTLTNPRFILGAPGPDYPISMPPIGTYAAAPEFQVRRSAPLPTDRFGNPWTWNSLIGGLVGWRIRLDFDILNFGDIVDLDVAEMWVEVSMPIPADVPAVVGAVVAADASPVLLSGASPAVLRTLSANAFAGLGSLASAAPLGVTNIAPNGAGGLAVNANAAALLAGALSGSVSSGGILASPAVLRIVTPDGIAYLILPRSRRDPIPGYFRFELLRRSGHDIACPRCHSKPCRCGH